MQNTRTRTHQAMLDADHYRKQYIEKLIPRMAEQVLDTVKTAAEMRQDHVVFRCNTLSRSFVDASKNESKTMCDEVQNILKSPMHGFDVMADDYRFVVSWADK